MKQCSFSSVLDLLNGRDTKGANKLKKAIRDDFYGQIIELLKKHGPNGLEFLEFSGGHEFNDGEQTWFDVNVRVGVSLDNTPSTWNIRPDYITDSDFEYGEWNIHDLKLTPEHYHNNPKLKEMPELVFNVLIDVFQYISMTEMMFEIVFEREQANVMIHMSRDGLLLTKFDEFYR